MSEHGVSMRKLEEIISENELKPHHVRMIMGQLRRSRNIDVKNGLRLLRMLREKCPHQWSFETNYKGCMICGKVEMIESGGEK